MSDDALDTLRGLRRPGAADPVRPRGPLQGLGLLHDRLRPQGQGRQGRERLRPAKSRLQGVEGLDSRARTRRTIRLVEVGLLLELRDKATRRRTSKSSSSLASKASGCRAASTAAGAAPARRAASRPPSRHSLLATISARRRRSRPTGSGSSSPSLPPIAAARRAAGARTPPMSLTIAFGAFQAIQGPLMQVVGEPGRAGQLVLDARRGSAAGAGRARGRPRSGRLRFSRVRASASASCAVRGRLSPRVEVERDPAVGGAAGDLRLDRLAAGRPVTPPTESMKSAKPSKSRITTWSMSIPRKSSIVLIWSVAPPNA